MIPTYRQLQVEVNSIRRTEKFFSDMGKNISIIRGNMVGSFKAPFAIYDGGDIQLMMKILLERGYTVNQNGEALYVRL